jgi:hypothetical protein
MPSSDEKEKRKQQEKKEWAIAIVVGVLFVIGAIAFYFINAFSRGMGQAFR